MIQWTVVVMLALAVGGHWVFLQTAAWVGMAVTYSQTDPLLTALKKTFDGEHPCQLCKVVAAGKKAEKTQPLVKSSLKIDLISVTGGIFIFPKILKDLVISDGRLPGIDRAPPLRPPPNLH